MKIEGSYLFDFPRDAVWELLLDPHIISKTLPGCEELVTVGENEYRSTLNIQVGPIQGQFEGMVRLSDLIPPESYHLKLSGRGASGFLEGEGDLRLENENGSTRLLYKIEAQLGGRIAAIGQRLLGSSARVITRQALEQLDRQIKVHSQGSQVSNQKVGDPSQTAFATKVAKGVLDDLIPPERRLFVVGAILATGVILFFVFSRTCS